MLQLFLRQISKQEKHLGVSLDYMRHIARTQFSAFLKFALFTPLANHRKKLPKEPYHMARLVACQHVDCGTCLQIEVNLAKQNNIDPKLIKTVLAGNINELDNDLATIYTFTKAVIQASYDESEQRERIRKLYGEAALVELALAIASCQVFPLTKRSLGYALSCQKVSIEIE